MDNTTLEIQHVINIEYIPIRNWDVENNCTDIEIKNGLIMRNLACCVSQITERIKYFPENLLFPIDILCATHYNVTNNNANDTILCVGKENFCGSERIADRNGHGAQKRYDCFVRAFQA